MYSFDTSDPIPIELVLSSPASTLAVASTVIPTIDLTAWLQQQEQELEQQTYEAQAARKEKMREGKGTDAAYEAHVWNYERCMEGYNAKQATMNTAFIPLNTHPITVTKVALFLEDEIVRLKASILFASGFIYLLFCSADAPWSGHPRKHHWTFSNKAGCLCLRGLSKVPYQC